MLEAGGLERVTFCNLNSYDLYFLHPRLFSKWQRTSSLTWVSALCSSMRGCGMGVGLEFGEQRWEGLAVAFQSSLMTAPHAPPSQMTSLSCSRRSSPRPETSAMLRCE